MFSRTLKWYLQIITLKNLTSTTKGSDDLLVLEPQPIIFNRCRQLIFHATFYLKCDCVTNLLWKSTFFRIKWSQKQTKAIYILMQANLVRGAVIHFQILFILLYFTFLSIIDYLLGCKVLQITCCKETILIKNFKNGWVTISIWQCKTFATVVAFLS